VIHKVGIKELKKGLAEESAGLSEVGNKFAYIGNVCDIATTLACNTELTTRVVHFLEQECVSPRFCCSSRCHKPGGSTANYNYSSFSHVLTITFIGKQEMVTTQVDRL
jgi:hypothetical protein